MAVMDVLPTLCAAANIKTGIATPIDGQNLWPAISSGNVQEHNPFVMGNRDTALFSGNWKLVSPGAGESPLLFDIAKDPNETNDLAAKNPEVLAKLNRELLTLGGSNKNKGVGGGAATKKAKRPPMGQGKPPQKKRGGDNPVNKKQPNPEN